ncbi:MAG: hypothetical protein WCS94_22420 [Verrucomicrobiota bacterium]
MFQAELKGKLPSSVSDREDVLTSNVFSFLKYSHRQTYLRNFLRLVGLNTPNSELHRVKFEFWPNYEDGTQPDVIIETDNCYLLVEAKYFSGVAEENGNPAGQLIREFETGAMEARNRAKSFRLLLLTDDATRPSRLLARMPASHQKKTSWTNWQAIAQMISDVLDDMGAAAPDHGFAIDLYELLDYKHLRGFKTFAQANCIPGHPKNSQIFFAAETASFRGAFIGFEPTLSILPVAPKPTAIIFYSTGTRFSLPIVSRPLFRNHIFLSKTQYEQTT